MMTKDVGLDDAVDDDDEIDRCWELARFLSARSR